MVRSLPLLLFFVFSILAPTICRADEGVVDEPYLVFALSESAHLRCGPSGDFYRTEPLRHGQELEVYVETTDGWLGVRPVEQSFCWVIAEAVELDKATRPRGSSSNVVGKGKIIENRTVAWIGTNLGRAKNYRWQVQLAEGEPVTILGSSLREGANGPQKWYRIVPPSGEFRWIHRDQVVTTAEDLLASVKPTNEVTEFLPEGESFVDDPELNAIIERREQRESQARRDRMASYRSESLAEPERTESPVDSLLAESADQEFNRPAPIHAPSNARPISFSQRVATGLSTIINGADEQPVLEPVTSSSRRVPDLVPIAKSPTGSEAEANVVGSGLKPVVAPEVTPIPVMPIASAPTTSLPSLSELAITSRPRMVPQDENVAGLFSEPNAWGIRQTAAFEPMPPRSFAPPNIRTISESSLTELRTQVASADSPALATLLSKLMSRAASAPEMEIIADAAERSGDMPLASRAREYANLARRRDGETVVAAATLSAPLATAPSIPREPTTQPILQSGIGPEKHNLGAVGPHDGVEPMQEGTLVEVYSPDPSRPPFALTDRSGRTLFYVTPGAGVNLKSHLGSVIRVTGQSGFLQGLDTPHVRATSAERLSKP